MKREEQGGRGRSESQRARVWVDGGAQEAARDEIEQDCIGSVEDHGRGMVPGRAHAPHDVVQPETQPRHRDVVSAQGVAEHPAKLLPAEPPELGVGNQVDLVVPVDELVPESRKKDQERREPDQRGCERPEPVGIPDPAAQTTHLSVARHMS